MYYYIDTTRRNGCYQMGLFVRLAAAWSLYRLSSFGCITCQQPSNVSVLNRSNNEKELCLRGTAVGSNGAVQCHRLAAKHRTRGGCSRWCSRTDVVAEKFRCRQCDGHSDSLSGVWRVFRGDTFRTESHSCGVAPSAAIWLPTQHFAVSLLPSRLEPHNRDHRACCTSWGPSFVYFISVCKLCGLHLDKE
jgi:hypothetical protein